MAVCRSKLHYGVSPWIDHAVAEVEVGAAFCFLDDALDPFRGLSVVRL